MPLGRVVEVPVGRPVYGAATGAARRKGHRDGRPTIIFDLRGRRLGPRQRQVVLLVLFH